MVVGLWDKDRKDLFGIVVDDAKGSGMDRCKKRMTYVKI